MIIACRFYVGFDACCCAASRENFPSAALPYMLKLSAFMKRLIGKISARSH